MVIAQKISLQPEKEVYRKRLSYSSIVQTTFKKNLPLEHVFSVKILVR